jgi:hypothetical protein
MKIISLFIIIVLLITGCTNGKKVDGVYRYYLGKNNNYDIWIVDGNQVRSEIFSSFLYGGMNSDILLTRKERSGSIMQYPVRNLNLPLLTS